MNTEQNTTNQTDWPACWKDAYTLLTHTDRVAMYGPSGTGKTYAAMHTARGKAYRVAMTGDNGTADLLGMWQPNAAGMWHYAEGVAIRAMREGARLVVDEVDRAAAEALGALLLLGDTSSSISWENPETHEIVTPAAGYSVVFTTNLEDWSRLDTALRDRMVAPVRISEPHPDGLARLPHYLRPLAKVSADAHGDERVSLRAWLEVTNLTAAIGLDDALRLVLGKDRGENIAHALRVEAATNGGQL